MRKIDINNNLFQFEWKVYKKLISVSCKVTSIFLQICKKNLEPCFRKLIRFYVKYKVVIKYQVFADKDNI